jgi:NAD(P)-dependent dehydrogenase (short-subunit alcohol dehydrogenase family)
VTRLHPRDGRHQRCRRDPAGRIGTAADVAEAALFALTSTFLTGQTLHIDGGEPLT